MDNFKSKLDAHFGPAFRATATNKNFDFQAALYKPYPDSEDGRHGSMWPNDEKDFIWNVSEVEERDDGSWLVHVQGEVWHIRKSQYADEFIKSMKAGGFKL